MKNTEMEYLRENPYQRQKALRALYDCRNHWQYLMITGASSKLVYEPSRDWLATCACCEYTSMYGYDCNMCLLVGYAWELSCEHIDSIYERWRNAARYDESSYTRKYYAAKMVAACNQAIEDILLMED